jgi:hypothetical protein
MRLPSNTERSAVRGTIWGKTVFFPGCTTLYRVVIASLGLAGCGTRPLPDRPLAIIAAELDAAVASAGRSDGVKRIRELLGHELPEVRAMAAQAAAAAFDWGSMPMLVQLLDDEDPVVMARSATACATLLGVDHGHDINASSAERAKTKEAIVRAYARMKQNPPPQYRQ